MATVEISQVLFQERDPRAVGDLIRDAAGSGVLDELEQTVAPALRGEITAVRSYVRACRSLLDRYLELAELVAPEGVRRTGHRLLLSDASDHPAPWSRAYLEHWFLQAPFSPLVTALGVGPGVAVELLGAVRAAIPGHEPLAASGAPLPSWSVDERDIRRFRRAVERELEGGLSDLERIARTFGLTTTELGGLFGVSRQAVEQWIDAGIPRARAEKVAAVASVCDLLARYVKAERLAGVARRGADAYGGRTMLEMIRSDDHDELLRLTRDSFNWSRTA